jgi:hypothetical protein
LFADKSFVEYWSSETGDKFKFMDHTGQCIATIERPIVINMVYEFLDDLRSWGITNMWGATAYIMEEFQVTEKVAGKLLVEWMKTFTQRHPEEK